MRAWADLRKAATRRLWSSARVASTTWLGTAAAELFARRHAEWADEAIAEWKQLLTRT